MQLISQSRIDKPHSGLRGLADVTLGNRNQAMLDQAARSNFGSAVWKARKLAEARTLLALSELAPPGRFWVANCDMQEDLRLTCVMKTPVPCRGTSEELVVHDSAMIGVLYQEAVLRGPIPGIGAIFILAPRNVFHANVSEKAPIQPLCLGPTLPRGIRCVDIILAAYGALSLQTVMIDELDPAGVLNPVAAQWWQQNRHRMPLSRTPFLRADEQPVSSVQSSSTEQNHVAS